MGVVAVIVLIVLVVAGMGMLMAMRAAVRGQPRGPGPPPPTQDFLRFLLSASARASERDAQERRLANRSADPTDGIERD